MFHLSRLFWIVPVFSGFVWLGMLLGMLLWWTVKEGSEYLVPMSPGQHIAYISDIGAHALQPLFIAAGTTTVWTFNLVFLAERWFRHRGSLVQNDTPNQKIMAVCAIIAAFIGGIGLTILTCLNDIYHHTAHDTCLVIFIAGYIISAIFLCAEYGLLEGKHREFLHLRASFYIKFMFIIVELALAIAFGVLSDKEKYNQAAVIEWTISLIYTFYVWSFVLDFIPIVRHREGFGVKYNSNDQETSVGKGSEMQQTGGYPAGIAQEQHTYSTGNGVNGAVAEPSRNF